MLQLLTNFIAVKLIGIRSYIIFVLLPKLLQLDYFFLGGGRADNALVLLVPSYWMAVVFDLHHTIFKDGSCILLKRKFATFPASGEIFLSVWNLSCFLSPTESHFWTENSWVHWDRTRVNVFSSNDHDLWGENHHHCHSWTSDVVLIHLCATSLAEEQVCRKTLRYSRCLARCMEQHGLIAGLTLQPSKRIWPGWWIHDYLILLVCQIRITHLSCSSEDYSKECLSLISQCSELTAASDIKTI